MRHTSVVLSSDHQNILLAALPLFLLIRMQWVAIIICFLATNHPWTRVLLSYNFFWSSRHSSFLNFLSTFAIYTVKQFATIFSQNLVSLSPAKYRYCFAFFDLRSKCASHCLLLSSVISFQSEFSPFFLPHTGAPFFRRRSLLLSSQSSPFFLQFTWNRPSFFF